MVLFDKNQRGSEEIQALTGTFAATNDYRSIEMEIRSATDALAGLVGWDVLERAEEAYLSDGPGREDFANAVRTPIAVAAVIAHSRDNLVSHEDTGRKFKADDHEKMPFEWMIDRDERALLDKYYRSLDALYAFLESNAVPEWMDSEQRRMRVPTLIHSMEDFERVYPVDHSWYVYYRLGNVVAEVCWRDVRKMVGSDRWMALTTVPVQEEQLPLLRMCQLYAVLKAVGKAVRRWGLEVFPLSIARRFAPSYQGNRASRAATTQEIEAYLAGLEEQLEDVRADIAEELSDGRNPYEGFNPMPHNDPRNKFFSAQ